MGRLKLVLRLEVPELPVPGLPVLEIDVLLEGGPTLAGAFLAAGCVDRVLAHVAPLLLGAGTSALGPAGVVTLADGVRLDVEEVDLSGPDVRISAVPRRP